MTDNKAALDALEELKKHRTPEGYLLRQFMPDQWKAIEAAITSPAVTDDELRKAVEDATEHLSICQPNRHRSAVETLIRAATAPKPRDNTGVHKAHCYQGEYEHGCKYGDEDCPAAPTVMGDDVRESVQVLQPLVDAWEFSSEITFAIKTLIRAATQPPQATDAQRRAALAWVNKMKPYKVGGTDTEDDAEPKDMLFAMDLPPDVVGTIKSALQSPAVPREVVESIAKWQDPNRMTAIARKFTKEITRNFYSVRPHDSDMIEENIRMAMEELIGEGRQDPMPISEALALLGGKDG